MFKDVIAGLSSSVAGAARETLRAYKPTAENAHGSFQRIASQGIANLSYRSPIMADMAQTMLHNFQVDVARRETIKGYVNSKDSTGLRSAVSANSPNASSKKIDAEMISILDRISKSVDNAGKEETKKTSLFKEYGKYFDEFKKSSNTQRESQKSQDSNGISSEHSDILNKIEANTLRTVNALELLSTKRGVGGTVSTQGGSNTFIDPMTGMPSLNAAVGTIGGSFLAKVFDDATIEKFAKQTKKLFGVEDEIEPKKVTPKKPTRTSDLGGNVDRMKEIFGDLSLDLNTDNNKNPVLTKDNNSESSREGFTKVSTENVSESAKEIESATTRRADELKSINVDILNELKTLNKKTEDKSKIDLVDKKSSTLLDKAKDKISDKVKGKIGTKGIGYGIGNAAGRGVGKAIQVGKNAASYVPSLAKAGSSALNIGRAAGATGLASGSAAAAALPGIGAAALALGAAGIAVGAGAAVDSAAGALGVGGNKIDKNQDDLNWKRASTWDKIKSAPSRGIEKIGSALFLDNLANQARSGRIESETKYLDNISAAEKSKVIPAPVKTNSANMVRSLTAEKTKQNSTESIKPIIISSGSGGGGNSNSSPQSGQSSINIVPTVRNQESTFERVQMQDFWSRTE